jgi:hypothetical protein
MHKESDHQDRYEIQRESDRNFILVNKMKGLQYLRWKELPRLPPSTLKASHDYILSNSTKHFF